MPWRPLYASQATMKSWLGKVDTADDPELDRAVEAASRAVDHYCHRQFGRAETAEARRYTAQRDRATGCWYVVTDDIHDAAGLTVAFDVAGDGTFTTVAPAGDVELRPVNAAMDRRPWTEVAIRRAAGWSPTGDVDATMVTALYGWEAIPAEVVQATLIQATRWMSRRDSPFGLAGGGSALGGEIRLLPNLDADLGVLLHGVRRHWAVAG